MTATENVLARAIEEIKRQLAASVRRCLIVHGEIGSGKTQFAKRLVTAMEKQQVKVGGIIGPRLLHEGETIGYKVRDISTARERLLATLNPPGISVGRFYLSEQALAFARAALERAARRDQVIVVDEVGRLELAGCGHAKALQVVLKSEAVVVLCVRTCFVKNITEIFEIDDHLVLRVSNEGNVT